MTRMNGRRGAIVGMTVMVLALTGASGCDGGGVGSGRPDTNAGAGLAVPPTENCTDLCQRLAGCVAILCNEDKMTTMYDALTPVLLQSCQSGCTDAKVMSTFTPAIWTCLYQQSCRAVFDYDVCNAMSHYNCS